MRKYLVWLPILLVLLGSCASTPDPEPKPEGPKVMAPKFVIVDHKNAAYGQDFPEWVSMDQIDLEAQDDFRDMYVFRFEETGQNLDGLKIWANGFSAQSEIARIVSTRVQDKFVGAAAGDKDMLETYMEEVVKVMADAHFTGYRKKGDYWVLRSFLDENGKEDRQEYLYVVLYTIDRDVLDELVEQSLESAGQAVKPKTEEEVTARERVKEAFAEGI